MNVDADALSRISWDWYMKAESVQAVISATNQDIGCPVEAYVCSAAVLEDLRQYTQNMKQMSMNDMTALQWKV